MCFLFIVFVAFGMYNFLIYYNGYCFYGTNGIKTSELIVTVSRINDIDYCNMLRESFNNDEIFSQFISLKFYDGSAIDHSYVVYQLYHYYGSKKFWQKASSLNSEDKMRVEGYLEYNYSL